MTNILKTEALVLRTLPWSESSKIVHLFTLHHGYLKGIAKGALRPRSPLRGLMESLNHVEVVVSSRERRGLQIITSAALISSFIRIREDLDRTAVAFSVLELLQQFFRDHEPVPPFFKYTIDLLGTLDELEVINLTAYLCHFLLRLGEILGFGWSLDKCLMCGKTPEKFPVQLDTQKGGVICKSCSSELSFPGVFLEKIQWVWLTALKKSSIKAVKKLVDSVSEQWLTQVSEILLHHLAYHTEAPLEIKSLKWYTR